MTEHPPIHQALARVMADVRAIGKDGRNTQQNFNFRGIDGTLNAVGPAFRDHGVIPLPRLIEHHSEIVEVGKNRTPMRAVTLTVEYTFIGPAGDKLSAVVPGEAMDSGDKAMSKAMSVALRTALLQTLAIPTEEKDPDEDSYERAPRRQEQPPRPPTAEELWNAALDPGNDRERMVRLHKTASHFGLLDAPVTGADGEATTLGDLIVSLGQKLSQKAVES